MQPAAGSAAAAGVSARTHREDPHMRISLRLLALGSILGAGVPLATVALPGAVSPVTGVAAASAPACAGPAAGEATRHTVLADFESGSAVLTSYPSEDLEPGSWGIVSNNTYGESTHALRLWGNTWKEMAIAPYAVTAATVFQAALYVEEKAEIQAIGFGDADGTMLFYAVAGTQLVLSDTWNVVYQGAYPIEEWRAYRLAIGQDWHDTYGEWPQLTRIVFVNDRDGSPRGATVFDEIYDVTDDLPQAPRVQIEALAGEVRKLDREAAPGVALYRVDVQFESLVEDPDSPTHTYHWDFGDGATSAEANPSHAFTATADYSFTISLDVTDETDLVGRDTCQVAVEPGGASGEFTMNFTGDAFMGRSYDQPGGLIDTYGVEYLWEPTRPILGDAADVTVVNAECAFTTRGTPHPTKSVVFRTHPENIAGLVYAGVDVATLGNNHIIDYGLEGMLQTEAVFDSVGIGRSGSGVNDYLALQPCYTTHAGVRVAIISACNRTGREYNAQPFLDAGTDKCGFGYWLEPTIARAVAQAESLADVVIACPHTGEEYETTPPVRADGKPFDIESCPPYIPESEAPEVRFRIWPGLGDRALRRLAIEQGADAVINNHPHVLQGLEAYKGRLIAHSLGNFMFDLSYAETLPTIVLTARVDKEGIRGWTFTPAFIDNLIPRPATGRLGREILGRMADYSRAMDTYVGVDNASLTGTVFLSPAAYYPEETESTGSAALVAVGDSLVSQPIELAGLGSLSAITALEGVPAGSEVRVGREVLWFGRFERDEGYHMWNLNSSDEWLDDTIFHEGASSLTLRRGDNDPGNVTTLLDRHLPASDSLSYGITGWMKTENATAATFAVRFYDSRYTWNQLATESAGEPVSGTTDWTWYGADFQAPDGAAFFNVRCSLDPPDAGDGSAWFDDLRVIEWQPWQPLDGPLPIAYPNNIRFVQVRTPAGGDSVTVTYTETALLDAAYSSVDRGRDDAPSCARMLGASPNPARRTTLIRYELSRPARVDLAVYDVAGRLVTRLARNETQRAGLHGVSWQVPEQRSGVYFVRLVAGGETHAGKVIVLR
jgi:poly-gamma-glutamate capsule biosynthesis protein CapA/YwtB (metallophosphatase superfamily)